MIGKTVVLYLGRDRGSYGFARVPGAETNLIDNSSKAENDPQRCADFPKGEGSRDLEGKRIEGDWFVLYSWYWLVKVGWS